MGPTPQPVPMVVSNSGGIPKQDNDYCHTTKAAQKWSKNKKN